MLMIAMLVGAGLAQTTNPLADNSRLTAVAAPAATKNAVDSAVTVGPGDAVLTVHGICSTSQKALPAATEDCAVVVKRQQFDDLMRIVAPGQGATAVKHSLAKTYTDLLALESAAKKSGIDTSPQFLETMEWLRVRTLADLYRRSLEKESSAVSEPELDEYYHEHISQFEEAKLRRIVLPRNNFAVADKQEFEKKALQIATDIRERAAKGEDLDQLQIEAYKALDFDGPPPASEVGSRRRNALTPEVSDDVFSLKAGEISKIEKEPYSFVIYKVEGKWTQPKERVREEIVREVARRKLETALKSVTADVRAELNEKYFGAVPEP
jgi:parvulin-like peptidyl-prolyl isomerase